MLGRAASCIVGAKVVGVFGEICPEILQKWEITMPCVVAEFDIDLLANFLA